MFEVTFLGTSASSPSAYRGLSGHLLTYRQHRFLIDCGEGTQRQILRSGLGFKRLNKILLTHAHLDHILGLGGLISTLTRWEALDVVDIYAGRATINRVKDLIYKVVQRGHRGPTDLNFITLKDGDTIVEDGHFSLKAFDVDHRGPDCLGFVFEEKSRRPFLADKAQALGVPFGPERGRLVQGETLTLADGRSITPEMVLGELIPGVKYVHIGDIGRTDGLESICQDADALTIEATYAADALDMARQFGHMTAADSAEFAQAANVKSLILTHISRRYSERIIREEARSIYPEAFVARDFDQFNISKERTIRTNLLNPR